MLSVEVIQQKFALKKLIPFFLKKREGVMGDGDFAFTLTELNEYLTQEKTERFNLEQLKISLENMKNFYVRNEAGKIIYPNTQLLECKIPLSTNKKIKIKKSITQNLENILFFIEKSIYLNERPEEYKNKSFFSVTQDHKLKFGDKIYLTSLETKEYAIFNALASNFNHECEYELLFEKVNNLKIAENENLNNSFRSAHEKIEYVSNGITELRKKLREISGNPDCIETMEGRLSKYRLIY